MRRWDEADDAPRLIAEVPALASLRMIVEVSPDGGAASTSKYTRHFVLSSAPAFFFVACSNPKCEDGGHDLTHEIMSGLKRGETEIRGEDHCGGSTSTSACSAAIRYTVLAEYRA